MVVLSNLPAFVPRRSTQIRSETAKTTWRLRGLLHFRDALYRSKTTVPFRSETVEPPRGLGDGFGAYLEISFTTAAFSLHEPRLREDREVLHHSLTRDRQRRRELRRGRNSSFSEPVEERATCRVIERSEDILNDPHSADMIGVESRPSANAATFARMSGQPLL